MSNNEVLHLRAEGLSVAMLFRMGFNEINKMWFKSHAVIHAKSRHYTFEKEIVVYAFFSRVFRSKRAAINRVYDNKFPRLDDYGDNIEFWVVDKAEHIYRLTKSDLKPLYNALNPIVGVSV